MRVIIIEDETPALNRIKKMLLEVSPEAQILATADSIENAVLLFQNHANEVDLTLMDIELADGQSFEIFNQIKITCPVIFTTAYDEFALKAFKVNSIDYLLKPIAKTELVKAIEKYKSVRKTSINFETEFQKLITQLYPKAQISTYKNRFLIKNGTKFQSISTEEIAYFYAHDKLVSLITHQQQNFIVDYTLDELDTQLDPKLFFQINRQFIANFKSIKKIHTYFNGKLKVELNPAVNDEVIVSRERASEFKNWLDQ
jgi:DNA-binding LytR/AlgR family response regulator